MADAMLASSALIPEPSATRRDTPVRCLSCGRAVSRKARQQRFCSTRCREREKKARQRSDRGHWGKGTGASPNPPKFVNENNGLQSRKWRPSLGISAPGVVVRGELLLGRKWERVTSSDGVMCLVARKAAR